MWRMNHSQRNWSNSTLLLRSEIPSGMCAKLRSVVASNNRVHMPWSLYYCLFAPHICMVLFFTHISFVVNHTINATPPERLQRCPCRYDFWQCHSLRMLIKRNIHLKEHKMLISHTVHTNIAQKYIYHDALSGICFRWWRGCLLVARCSPPHSLNCSDKCVSAETSRSPATVLWQFCLTLCRIKTSCALYSRLLVNASLRVNHDSISRWFDRFRWRQTWCGTAAKIFETATSAHPDWLSNRFAQQMVFTL